MYHDEVRVHLETAHLSPGKLQSLDAESVESGEALRAHLAACAACRAELEALRNTAAVLAAGAPDSLRAPSGGVERLLEAVRTTGVARSRGATASTRRSSVTRHRVADRWSRGRVLAVLAASAAAVVLVAAGLLGVQLVQERDRASQQARELGRIAALTNQVLRQPDGERVVLVDARGNPAGTLVYSRSSRDLVVVSETLAAPVGGSRYACYVERGRERTQIGWMRFSQGLAYWGGKMGGPSDAGREGDRFVVVLDSAGGAPALAGEF